MRGANRKNKALHPITGNMRYLITTHRVLLSGVNAAARGWRRLLSRCHPNLTLSHVACPTAAPQDRVVT
jgi:hypothetical protein